MSLPQRFKDAPKITLAAIVNSKQSQEALADFELSAISCGATFSLDELLARLGGFLKYSGHGIRLDSQEKLVFQQG